MEYSTRRRASLRSQRTRVFLESHLLSCCSCRSRFWPGRFFCLSFVNAAKGTSAVPSCACFQHFGHGEIQRGICHFSLGCSLTCPIRSKRRVIDNLIAHGRFRYSVLHDTWCGNAHGACRRLDNASMSHTRFSVHPIRRRPPHHMPGNPPQRLSRCPPRRSVFQAVSRRACYPIHSTRRGASRSAHRTW